MLCKRIIPCLDVQDGRTVKGVKFQQLKDMGDPMELAVRYQEQRADELVFLDISATRRGRSIVYDLVRRVSRELLIPFTVGGGIRSFDDASRLLENGADKVSVNTAAVNEPQLITRIADRYGSQCCVVAVDARKASEEHWEVLTSGGTNPTGLDALEWCGRAEELGAGEILLTSWDRDGTTDGFDLELTSRVSGAAGIPVIASGGAGGPSHFLEVFTTGKADAALAAGIFHRGEWSIPRLKEELHQKGIEVRL